MMCNDIKLKKRLNQIRTDLKYYKEMTPEEYINDRVLYKIKLYYLFGQRNKCWYHVLAVVSIIMGLSIPILLNLDIKYSKQYATVVTLLTGGIISLEAAVFNFKDKYKSYKKTEDQLTNELMLYQTNTEPYQGDKIINNKTIEENTKSIFGLFVGRIESIILKEREDTIEKLTRISLEQLNTTR